MQTIERHRRSDRYREAIVPSTEVSALFANDGYKNSIASIGESSTLMNAGQYVRNSITNNYELLTNLYRENWIAKRIIDAPCEDMTRAWYSISSQLEDSKLNELAKAESRHSVKDEITNALRWARLYGGAAALMVIKGQEDMLDELLDMDMLMPGCFRGLIVLDRWTGIEPSIELEEDMDDTDFGYPKFYDVYADATHTKSVRVHHSRLLRFVGRELPYQDEVNENYWGASELEHVYEELNKRNATSANIAQLVFQANVRTLKMADMGEMFSLGTEQQKSKVVRAVSEQNRLLSSFGVQILNATDSYENHPYTFSGISDVYESFMMDMAGAADIPATKLYGRSPAGMNATGENDMKNYYERIAQLQEKYLRPALEKLLPVMAMSCWGAIPDDMEIIFEPVQTTTPSERATIAAQLTTAVTGAVTAGVVSPKVALKELRENGKDIGFWTNITDDDIKEAEEQQDGGDMPPAADPLGGMPPDPNGGGSNPPQMLQIPTEGAGQTNPPQQAQVSSTNTVSDKIAHDEAIFNDSFEGHEGRKGKVGGSLPKGSSGSGETSSSKNKTYSSKELAGMSLSRLKKIAEPLAAQYYKSGASGISFGSTSPEEAAKMLTNQSKSESKLRKDILSIQKKMEMQEAIKAESKEKTLLEKTENPDNSLYSDPKSSIISSGVVRQSNRIAKRIEIPPHEHIPEIQALQSHQEIVDYFTTTDAQGNKHCPIDSSMENLGIVAEKEAVEGIQHACNMFGSKYMPKKIKCAPCSPKAIGESYMGVVTFAPSIKTYAGEAFSTGVHETAHNVDDGSGGIADAVIKSVFKEMGLRSNSRKAVNLIAGVAGWNVSAVKDMHEIVALAIEDYCTGHRNEFNTAIAKHLNVLKR